MRVDQINRMAVKLVANALGELNQCAVFVGGAVVALYVDDNLAEDVRETKDVDISMEITGLGELESIREKLNKKGFTQSAEDHVMCRFRLGDIKVDVMSTKEIGWAPANPWFEPGFKSLKTIDIDGTVVRILPLPYFLASKFEAFNDRGGTDPRTSHDLEDIVYLLDHTSDIHQQLLKAGNDVQEFLKSQFTKLQSDESLQEAILGHLANENQNIRFNKILGLIKQFTNDI